jgi:hypothetical protein
VRREVAIYVPKGCKVIAQELEVERLFFGNLQPLGVESFWHASESPNKVQRQIDCVQFNVRERVDEGCATLSIADIALFHL